MAGCLALAGLGAQAGGGALSFIGQRRAGKAARAAGKARQRALNIEAAQTQRAGFQALRDIEQEKQAAVGKSRVAAAKSGVRVGTGSALRAEKKIVSEYDKNKRRFGEGVANRVAALRARGEALRRRGTAIKKAKDLRAFASLLGSSAAFAEGFGEIDFGKKQKDISLEQLRAH